MCNRTRGPHPFKETADTMMMILTLTLTITALAIGIFATIAAFVLGRMTRRLERILEADREIWRLGINSLTYNMFEVRDELSRERAPTDAAPREPNG